MNRVRAMLWLLVALASALGPLTDLQAQSDSGVSEPVDQGIIDGIRAEGLNRSRIGGDLRYLADVVGPRLTGSPAMDLASAPIVDRPIDAEQARGYVGRYRRGGQVVEVELIEGALHLEFDDGSLARLLWQDADAFMVTDGWPSPVRFTRNADGAVDSLLVTDVGALRYTRLPKPTP